MRILHKIRHFQFDKKKCFCMKLGIPFTDYRLQMSNKKNKQLWHYTATKVIYAWTAVSYANTYYFNFIISRCPVLVQHHLSIIHFVIFSKLLLAK